MKAASLPSASHMKKHQNEVGHTQVPQVPGASGAWLAHGGRGNTKNASQAAAADVPNKAALDVPSALLLVVPL